MYIILRKCVNVEPGDICFKTDVVREKMRMCYDFLTGVFCGHSDYGEVSCFAKDVGREVRGGFILYKFAEIAADSSLGLRVTIAYHWHSDDVSSDY